MTARADAPPTKDPWAALRRHTAARIGLGQVGNGLPTAALLDLQMAHARARDAVQAPFDSAAVGAALESAAAEAALGDPPPPRLTVYSAAPDRSVYLQRPDLGRRLDAASARTLRAAARDGGKDGSQGVDLCLILGDGLSARAVHDHGPATLRGILSRLDATWRVAPVVLAHQARVALGDDIGRLLGAQLTVMLIGERPGLSSAESLGAYLTWGPAAGRCNADRNCVSNIRPEGLPPDAAAEVIVWLLREARRRERSGVTLKYQGGAPVLPSPS
jgi:ethanolamine ammonia-lyase small subunit